MGEGWELIKTTQREHMLNGERRRWLMIMICDEDEVVEEVLYLELTGIFKPLVTIRVVPIEGAPCWQWGP